jgi:PIN domain nuclease of toxin-antitoxin system
MSGFEIALKNQAGKLLLPARPFDWFQAIIKHHDISVIDLNMEICIKAKELPQIHKDPCDRFIIATAMIYNLPVITADKHFSKYNIHIIF